MTLRLSALRRLYELIGRLISGRSLTDVLQAVVDGVVEGLGFGVAAVNLTHDDGSFEVVAVAGSDEAREQLVGLRSPPEVFDREFAVAEHWGALRFVPHDRLPPDQLTGWVPGGAAEAAQGPDLWHPLDALFAPLTSPSGELVGMLSVDLPTADDDRTGCSGSCWRCSPCRPGSRSTTPGSASICARVRPRSGSRSTVQPGR